MRADSKKRNGNSWCGPSAMTVVTGLTYEECEAAAKKATGRDRILGLQTWGLRYALAALGWHNRRLLIPPPAPGRKCVTLRNLVSNVEWRRGLRGVVIVNVTSHYVAFDPSTGKVFDQFTPEGVDWRKHHSRKARVKNVWEFYRRTA